MLTKRNWISSNILDRFINRSCDFQVNIFPYDFKELSFSEASDYACNEIYKEYKNLYLALSGGLDSEYVLRAFVRNNIPIQPIIVCCGNEEENHYAHLLCNELNISPIVINVSEKKFLEYYIKLIANNLGGVGYNITQVLFAAEYSMSNNGMLITGDNFLGDGVDLISDQKYALVGEWQFYTEALNMPNIDFFLYTPELAYSMMPKVYDKWNVYKSKLYCLTYRDKIRAKYSRLTIKILNHVSTPLCTKQYIATWSKDEFLDLFKIRK